MRHIVNEWDHRPLCGAEPSDGDGEPCPDCEEADRLDPALRPWAYGDEPEPLETSDSEEVD